jgi:Uma2 family endonuclease
MTVLPRHQLTADEFAAWSEKTIGRFELQHGYVYEMPAELTGHAEVKFAVQTALVHAIRSAGVNCHMLPDGIRVRVGSDVVFEPDALVYCGAKHPRNTLEVNNPSIVVEVLSPSTRSIDASAKLAGYFLLPSVAHYLIVDPTKLPVIHHARLPDGTILTRLISSGVITMMPPGIELSVDGLLD